MRHWAIVLAFLGIVSSGVPQREVPSRDGDVDRKSIADLEETWLHARDARTLDRVLAPDFLHPVPSGILVTREQHIAWYVSHLPPADQSSRFETLKIRLYGDIALVNGIVATKDRRSPLPRRTIFTDVFAFREGHGRPSTLRKTRLRPPGP